MNAAIHEWRQRAEEAALLGNMEQEIAARQELVTRSMAAGDGAGARAALDRTLVPTGWRQPVSRWSSRPRLTRCS